MTTNHSFDAKNAEKILREDGYLYISNIPKLVSDISEEDSIKLQENALKMIINKELSLIPRLSLQLDWHEQLLLAYSLGQHERKLPSKEFFKDCDRESLITLPHYFFDDVFENNDPKLSDGCQFNNFKDGVGITNNHYMMLENINLEEWQRVVLNFIFPNRILISILDIITLLKKYNFSEASRELYLITEDERINKVLMKLSRQNDY